MTEEQTLAVTAWVSTTVETALRTLPERSGITPHRALRLLGYRLADEAATMEQATARRTEDSLT